MIRASSRVTLQAIAFAIACGSLVTQTAAFMWPPDYAEQSRQDVATCVSYARRISPDFEAEVREVDLATGRVDIQRSAGDARGEVAFSKCLVVVRQWRLIERNLPRPADPDPAAMAKKVPASFIR